ncbi:hypothetical protein ACFQS1_19630 [Paractinoplanes rhizophilus]|uniref:Uncharacterized protein n=1 Tax=Paractinoplanes rhizophilus TaxID=1416877 RepID=A0ABW2HX68_9ACTN
MTTSYTETYAGYLPDLGMSPAMDDLLRDVLDNHDDRGEIEDEINQAITAKLREFGVDADTGEWRGEWSPEQIVRGVLAGRGIECPAVPPTGDQMLAELAEVAARLAELDERRDELVRGLMRTSVARKQIASAARLSEPRLYQIRDRRR